MKKRILGVALTLAMVFTASVLNINDANADCTLTTNAPTGQCVYITSQDTFVCAKKKTEANCVLTPPDEPAIIG